MALQMQGAAGGDEPRLVCIIRDMTNTEIQNKFTLTMPVSFTCQQLMEEVGQRLGYEADSFALTYELQAQNEYEEVDIQRCADQRLGNVCGDGRRHNFTVYEKDGRQPVKASGSDKVHMVSFAMGSASCLSLSDNPDSNVSSASSSSGFTDYSYSYSAALIKSDTGFVGLVNQAMTCYLNSLLQTLFMTPEFRNAIYRWEFKGHVDEATRTIPYQLQRLFLQLQTSKKRAVETTDITKSFGWDSSESWQQHDVQELCRVMFDALEKTWSDTDQSDLINQLYQGKMKDYVKCLECGNESARTDCYLDVPLTIRPFGSNQAFGSVEEAIKAFVQPETLDGNNQYFCERCNKKCNAHKGLKFLGFPYLLTLQLKRFDFDYSTMHRIKLNDRMSFNEILNLNHLVEDPGDPTVISSEADVDDAENQVPVAEEVLDEGIDLGDSASASSDSLEAPSAEAAANTKNTEDSQQTGPFEYELFSIMIHSGSAAGGHYYAYIKNFNDGQWYSFNDQHVTTVTYDDIRKTFGGSSSSRVYYSSAFASSTNAYMLMYRQIDKERNKEFMTLDQFPEHLTRILHLLKDREEQERRQRELDRCMCKIKLFCFHPVHLKNVESRLEVHKDKTLQEATEIAWKQLELENVVPLDCVRLVRYDEFHDWIDLSYEDESVTMGVLLCGVKSIYTFDLLLEIKSPEQTFEEYKPGGVTVKVYVVDLASETLDPAPHTVRAYFTQYVSEFKNLVAQRTGLPAGQMRCVLERYAKELKLLSVSNKTLKAEGFVRSNKVFIECSGTEDDRTANFTHTKFFHILDRYENTIRVHVTLPPFKTVETYINATGVTSVAKPNQDTPSDNGKNGQDLDEGIGESESDSRLAPESPPDGAKGDGSVVGGTVATCPLSPQDGATGDGPVKAVSRDNDAIHSYLGGAIQRELSTDHSESGNESAQSSHSSSQQTSPEENAKEFASGREILSGENWETEDVYQCLSGNDAEHRRSFTASMHIDTETSGRSLTVCVDERISLGAFKQELEHYVGVPADMFRIYRVYGNSQEIETVRLTDNLSCFGDDSKMTVKFGRALKKGEHRVKVYQLHPNQSETCKFLLETIFHKSMNVLESKEKIVDELQRHCQMTVPVDRLRLRKKTCKSPGKIYLDRQKHEDQMMTSWEIFMEVLDGPEQATSLAQLAIYIRQWRPSLYEIGSLEEVVLNKQTVQELKEVISSRTDIPVECVEIAKGRGTFPCEVGVLTAQTELDWNPDAVSLNSWPLHIYEDGNVVYYRDSREKLMELSDEKKKELQQKENSRLPKTGSLYSYSIRKEKALKIYTDQPSSQKSSEASSKKVLIY